MNSRGLPEFWEAYRELSPEIKEAARAAFKKFQLDPLHPSLRLERLRSDARFWSVRVTRDYRAVALRLHDDTWVWAWIGSHKDFDRRFPA